MPRPASLRFFVPRAHSCVLVAVLIACLVGARPVGAAPRAAPPRPAAALGAHAMLYLNAPVRFKEAMIAEAVAVGASVLRADVPFALLHPERDAAADYWAFDTNLRLAAQAGVGLVGVMTATPWWAARCPADVPLESMFTCPYADMELFKQHVREAARRGRGVIRAWEVLNEPEGPWFRGTPEDYAVVLDAAITAIHEGDPSAKVVIGGTPYNKVGQDFLTRVLRVEGLDLARRIDVANLHVRGPLASLARQVRSWRAFMRSLGVDKPLWVTEFGYPSDEEAQLDGNFGGFRQVSGVGSGEVGQASYLRRAIPALLRGGAAKVFVTLRDGSPGLFQSEGIVRGDGVADPPGENPVVVRKAGFGAVRHLVLSGALTSGRIRGMRRRAAVVAAARRVAAGPGSPAAAPARPAA